MQTRNLFFASVPVAGHTDWLVLLACLLLIFGFTGCSKDPALAAIETDANGFYCEQCRAKVLVGPRDFPIKCPKCQQDSLVKTIGYFCEKDKHVTVRPHVPGPEGAATCEKCGVPLNKSLVRPHAKDLKAWGATTAPH